MIKLVRSQVLRAHPSDEPVCAAIGLRRRVHCAIRRQNIAAHVSKTNGYATFVDRIVNRLKRSSGNLSIRRHDLSGRIDRIEQKRLKLSCHRRGVGPTRLVAGLIIRIPQIGGRSISGKQASIQIAEIHVRRRFEQVHVLVGWRPSSAIVPFKRAILIPSRAGHTVFRLYLPVIVCETEHLVKVVLRQHSGFNMISVGIGVP